MTPEQRKAWLKAHGAPPDMMLVRVGEFVQMTKGLVEGQKLLVAMKASLNGIAEALGDYTRADLTLPHSAADAVFDARKHERATEASIARLEKTLGTLEIVIEAVSVHQLGAAAAADLITERKALFDLVEFLKAQRDAKRVPPPPGA